MWQILANNLNWGVNLRFKSLIAGPSCSFKTPGLSPDILHEIPCGGQTAFDLKKHKTE